MNGPIAKAVRGMDALDQRGLDGTLIDLDGTPDKAALGANAMLGVSLAVAKAAADSAGQPLYRYLGRPERAHAADPDAERDQRRRARRERAGAPGVHVDAGRRRLVLRGDALGVECFHALRGSCTSGDVDGRRRRGRVRARLATAEEALELSDAGDRAAPASSPAPRWRSRLDPAASELYKDARYHLEGADRTADDMVAFWADLLGRFPIVSLEDPLAEDDWEGLGRLHARARHRVQLVGDDIFVTNPERLERGICAGRGERDPREGEPDRDPHRDARRDRGGTAHQLRRRRLPPQRRDRGHHDRRPRGRDERRADQGRRSSRGERTAKYNQLLRIEGELGEDARFGSPFAGRPPGGDRAP